MVPSWTLAHPSFPDLVREGFEAILLHKGSDSSNTFVRLQVLKEAIRDAAKEIQHSSARTPASTVEEQLAVSI